MRQRINTRQRIGIGVTMALIAAVGASLLGGCSSAGAQTGSAPAGQNVYYNGPRPKRSIQYRNASPNMRRP